MAWLRREQPSDASIANEASLELENLLVVGRYFSHYYRNDGDWLIRRIDTVDIVNDSEVSVRSSLTIDGRILADFQVDTPREGRGSGDSVTYLPLPATPKQLLGQFDVRVEGTSLPVLASIDNAKAAVGIMVAFLVDNGVPVSAIDRDTIDILYQIASVRTDDDLHRQFAEQLGVADVAGPVDLEPGLEDLLDKTLDLEDIEFREFSAMLADFLSNFTAIVAIPTRLCAAEFVVKTFTLAMEGDFRPIGAQRPVLSYPYLLFVEPYKIGLILFAIWREYVRAGGLQLIRRRRPARNPLRTEQSGRVDRLERRKRDFWKDKRRTLVSAIWKSYKSQWSHFRRALRVKRFARSIENPSPLHRVEARLCELYQWAEPVLRIPPVSGVFLVVLSNTNLGLYGSQHFRILVPDDAKALEATIVTSDGQKSAAIERRAADNWVALHANNRERLRSSTVELSVQVLPRNQSFLSQAFYAAFVTATMFTVGFLAEVIGWLMNPNASPSTYGLSEIAVRSSGGIITVLMIAPSIYTVILLKQNEHRFIAHILHNTRRVIGTCAVVSASVAIPIALDFPRIITLVWWVLGGAACIFSLWHVAAARYIYRTKTNLRVA